MKFVYFSISLLMIAVGIMAVIQEKTVFRSQEIVGRDAVIIGVILVALGLSYAIWDIKKILGRGERP